MLVVCLFEHHLSSTIRSIAPLEQQPPVKKKEDKHKHKHKCNTKTNTNANKNANTNAKTQG